VPCGPRDIQSSPGGAARRDAGSCSRPVAAVQMDEAKAGFLHVLSH
jgi:hypothetical protein